MNLFKVSIVTPDGAVFEDTVESLVAPGVNGAFTVLAGHAPLLAATRNGVLKIVKQGREQFFAAGESLIEVTRNQTLVLATQAAPTPDLNSARAQAEQFLRNNAAPKPRDK